MQRVTFEIFMHLASCSTPKNFARKICEALLLQKFGTWLIVDLNCHGMLLWQLISYSVIVHVIVEHGHTSVLPDMCTLVPRACSPRDEGAHIRKNTCAHVTTIMYHFSHMWANICMDPRC